MSRVRPNVLAAKQQLADGYGELRNRHQAGASGVEISTALTDLRDRVLLDLYDEAVADLYGERAAEVREQVMLVAHGGYGRRDVAPFSDVDMMVLHEPSAAELAVPVAERLLRDVFDAGLVLGHSLCTPRQAWELALQDPLLCTSLGESRLLTGRESFFNGFYEGLRKLVTRRSRSVLVAIEKARGEERLRYGETVFLLEPNVKRSRGGLRDMQLIRWIGFARYGLADPSQLVAQGALSEEDYLAFQKAGEFLLRLRNELHFQAGKSADVLDRFEQLRIAELWGYDDLDGMLHVEKFMRDYFRHTDQISHLSTRFLAQARSKARFDSIVSVLFGHRVEDEYRVGPAGVMATRRGLARLLSSMAEVLRLVDLANLYDKPIAPTTWEPIRRQSANYPANPDETSIRYFLSLVSHSARLGEMLRNLHEAGLLERFIPAFVHARGLLQFNQYHKYTVDEHCLRAVEAATDLMLAQGALGQVYRRLSPARKRILHLALLIHDLGKGYPEDHIIVGTRLAAETGHRLGLPAAERETLEFLVAQHQMMGHVAYRRDTTDPQLLLKFALDVGSPDRLALLFLVTACDFSAVGPDVWDGWKAEILTDLYTRAMQHLAGDSGETGFDRRIGERREELTSLLLAEKDSNWYSRQLANLPGSYLANTSARQAHEDLRLLHDLSGIRVEAKGQFSVESGVLQFTVATREDVCEGIFHRLTGALSASGLEIFSAEINTLADGLVLDRFWVNDPDYVGKSPPDRIHQIERSLVESLRAPTNQPPSFRKTWQTSGRATETLTPAATRVNIDNSSSDRYTVVDVFAHDRTGLLYAITRTLFELGLSVWRAKIATHLDQVVDVFYVTDRDGTKLEDEGRLRQVIERLTQVVAESS